MKSTMFLNNITCIDHAWVDSLGEIHGNSYNLCAEITGEVDETEQVVIDFSGCKKEIKNLIDESEHAIDHRIVLIKGFSDYTLDLIKDERVRITTECFNATSTVDDWYQEIELITTNHHIHKLNMNDAYKFYLGVYIEAMLLKQLKLLGYPVTNVTVELSESFDLPVDANTHVAFNYAHGLRSSTSYGCQNIAHGHRSYIAIDSELNDAGMKLLKQIASEMSGYIAWKDNINDDGSVSYTSLRGNFYLMHSKVLELPTETTVENLAEYIATTYNDTLRNSLGATRLWVSEGLSKGAVVDL